MRAIGKWVVRLDPIWQVVAIADLITATGASKQTSRR